MITEMLRNIGLVTLSMLLLSTSACGLDLPVAKVTLKVVDENGTPIKDAKAGVGFESVYRFKGGINDVGITGLTDENGIFTASHDTLGYIGFGAEVKGYYPSRSEYRFTKHESGKWQPWNPEVKVVMRKIEKPVPMYARDLHQAHPEILIPVVGKNVGFDLIEGDWVAPYGTGKHADLIFKLERKINSNYDYKGMLTLSFANKLDGIYSEKDDRKSGSVFKLQRFAPENGYQHILVKQIECHGIGTLKTDFQDDNNYYVRIRSEEKDGKLVRAMYGKIQGDIKFYSIKGIGHFGI